MPEQRRSVPGAVTATAPARFRVGGALLAGLVAGIAVALLGPAELAPLAGWDVAALVWLLPLVTLRRMDAGQTRRMAARDDPSRAAADTLLLGAAVASLGAVAIVLVGAGNQQGTAKALYVGLAVASVVLSWTLVHARYTLRYARLYYGEPPGGIDFNQGEPPRFTDFAYLAFTVGMTYQVSDTSIKNGEIRRTALRHALLSYLFGTVIVATAINVVAGLSR